MSLVQGAVRCSGRTLYSVRSQNACGLVCCIYLFETVRTEIRSSSNGLLSAAIINENCGKMSQFQTLHQYNPAVSTGMF